MTFSTFFVLTAFLFSSILFLDSLRFHNPAIYAEHVREWLNFEWKRLDKGEVDGEVQPYHEDTMILLSPQSELSWPQLCALLICILAHDFLFRPCFTPVPYQLNGCDCGVFICRYAYALFVMRHEKFTWEDVSKLITRGSAFKFGMADIARIRKEVLTLIDRLSMTYLKMKTQEKAARRAKRKKAKTSKTHEKERKENIPESQDTEVPPAPAAKSHKAEH